jgi:hypothetical protein
MTRPGRTPPDDGDSDELRTTEARPAPEPEPTPPWAPVDVQLR